ncbi:MAG: response regulator [Deltaproteobacteria bacterium]|nr:response regulator [Deltaproteobacteria bacterium]
MKLLIADDEFIARKTLSSMLTKEGFDCQVVENGDDAFEILTKAGAPNIAILDWQMPGLNGIDIIKRLRESTEGYVYCILLTGKSNPEDIAIGFAAGADDFLTKPPDLSLIRQKLNVAKRIMKYEANEKLMKEELAKYAASMKKIAEERAVQLVHADRMVTIGTLVAGVAHEINNPTTFISVNAQTLEQYWSVLKEVFNICPKDHPDYEKLMFIAEETPQVLQGILSGTKRINSIVSGLKSFSRQDKPKSEPYDIHKSIDTALELCVSVLKHNVKVEKKYFPDMPQLTGDSQKIEQVLVNLFTNAVDAMAGTKSAQLTIGTDYRETTSIIFVQDNGPGLTDEAMKRIWDPFFTTKPVGKGTGLGMSISAGIIEGHNGTLKVKNRPEGGAEFVISLPVNE